MKEIEILTIYEGKGMLSLVKKAGAIFKEIEKVNSPDFKPLKLTHFNFDDRKPEELPE